MYAKRSQKPGQPDKLSACIAKTEDEIPIYRELKTLVHSTAGAFPDGPPPEKAFLGEVIYPRQDLVVVRGQYPSSNFPVVFIDHNSVAINGINIRIAAEILCHVSKNTRQEKVVRIEIGHNFATGV